MAFPSWWTFLKFYRLPLMSHKKNHLQSCRWLVVNRLYVAIFLFTKQRTRL